MVTSRVHFTSTQKAEMWERWKRGESISTGGTTALREDAFARKRRTWRRGLLATARPINGHPKESCRRPLIM